MNKVTQIRRMKEALREIHSTAQLVKDCNWGCFAVLGRIEKLSKAAIQQSSTKDTAATWTMMNWRSKK